MFFSILIPAYKTDFLYEAIESCLKQTYQDYEIIVVDDCSPEDIKGIVAQFDSEKIRYFRNSSNCGAIDVVDNWNRCLEYARGEYVICMGDDDCLFSNCLSEYVALIEKYPHLDVYHGRTEIIDEHSELKSLQESRPEWESAYSVLYHQCQFRRRQFLGDLLFKTEMLRKNGGFYKLALGVYSDNISGLMAACTHGVANTQKIVFRYRDSNLSLSRNPQPRILADSINTAYHWYSDFLETEPQHENDRKFRTLLCKGVLRRAIVDNLLYCIMTDVHINGQEAIGYWKSKYRDYPITEGEFFSLLDQLRYKKFRDRVDSIKIAFKNFFR
ncbi:MAG: glycosyltransferase family 2 protein [Alloprevotella sp.]